MILIYYEKLLFILHCLSFGSITIPLNTGKVWVAD